jgi:hypothetical protein
MAKRELLQEIERDAKGNPIAVVFRDPDDGHRVATANLAPAPFPALCPCGKRVYSWIGFHRHKQHGLRLGEPGNNPIGWAW